MKKICYLVVGGERISSGYYQKICRTLVEWQRLGYDGRLVIGASKLSPLAQDWLDHRDQFPEGTEVYLWTGWVDRICRELKVVNAIIKSGADVIYIRNTYYSPALLVAGVRIPVFVEVNTVETSEFSGKQLILRMLSNICLFAAAKQLFAVTSEIRDRLVFKSWRKKTSVISNGIDLGAVSLVQRDSTPGLHGVFLGAENRPWHGIDKILHGAHLMPEITFHLCGRFDVPFTLPHNVVHHGFLMGEALGHCLAKMDFGIGSMALHRKSMAEACPLKVREYLAYGLPVVIGYRDTDIPNDAMYALNLGNDEGNFARGSARIVNFARQWNGLRVDREMIRHIGIAQKEAQRLEIMSRCVDGVFRPSSTIPS